MKKKLLDEPDVTTSIMHLQEKEARQFIESRDRLVALNVLFDAVLAGESGREIARNMATSDLIKKEKINRCLLDLNHRLKH